VNGLGRKLHAPAWIAWTASSNDANAVTISTFIHGASAQQDWQQLEPCLIADALVEDDHIEHTAADTPPAPPNRLQPPRQRPLPPSGSL